MLYYVVVALFMFALPAVSVASECLLAHASFDAALIVKWYVFWAVGGRLFLAGARQIVQPDFTSREILGHKSDESIFLVRELGFANVAMSAIALASLLLPSWRLPAALAGGIFYAFAGGNHLLHAHRNTRQNVAMLSDLLAASVLLLGLILAVRR